MMRIRTSAPGKVVLTGEYAVLEGAPAIVMAVDRRARVCVSKADGDRHRVSAPGLLDGDVDLSTGDAIRVTRRDADRAGVPLDLSLVEQVLMAVGAHAIKEPLHLELDTRPFFHERKPVKLGFGSSAALAVALTAALMHAGERSHDVARTALAAHRAWQGGRGSGVDVAAAVHGGMLVHRAMAGTAVEVLGWPQGLCHALLWSGRPASTRNRIGEFRESARRHGNAGRLVQAAEEMADTWRRGGARAILDGLSRYVPVLAAFDVDRDLGIFDAGHRELADAAGSRVVYKPCGAGGGDIGIALALKEDDLDGFVEKAQALGFERLNAMPDARGVRYSAGMSR